MKLVVEQEDRITKQAVEETLAQLKNGELNKSECIRQLFAGGLSVKEIAETTKILYNQVYNVCKNEVVKNGLTDSIITAREGGTKKDQIIALLEKGKTITEVSTELRCLYNQVWQVAKAAGYTKKQKEAVVLTKTEA